MPPFALPHRAWEAWQPSAKESNACAGRLEAVLLGWQRPPGMLRIATGTMITSFDHLHLYSADLGASLRFYERVLGAERVGKIPNDHGDYNHVLLLGGQYLVFSHYPTGMAARPPPGHADGALTHGFGVAHLGINVRRLDAMMAKLEAAGMVVHDAPRGGGAVRYVYFTAPDGVVIELTEYVVPEGLRPAIAALDAFNKFVHLARRSIGRVLIARATASNDR